MLNDETSDTDNTYPLFEAQAQTSEMKYMYIKTTCRRLIKQ